MQDAILNKTMRFTIISTVAILSLACLILAYMAIFDAIARHWPDAAARLVWSASSALAALLLITWRGELIDD